MNNNNIKIFLLLILIIISIIIFFKSPFFSNDSTSNLKNDNLINEAIIIDKTTMGSSDSVIDKSATSSLSEAENSQLLQEDENFSNKLKPTKIYKEVMTSFFWVGEKAAKENNYISNHASVWDDYWQENFGGIDSSTNRCDYNPCSFTPKENTFYFALPYNDLKRNDKRKNNSKEIKWYNDEKDNMSILKNKWIEIVYKNKYCYAQWEDVGPNNENDFDYVFGNSHSTNRFGIKAGLDISPAVRDYLSMKDNDFTKWKFIEYVDVPNGPWKNIITHSNVTR